MTASASPRLSRATLARLTLLGNLYFAQGLPFGFFVQALPVLLRAAGYSLGEIGLASLLAMPWALKFLWAPLVDRTYWPRLGRRRTWILAMQLAATVVLVAIAIAPGSDSLPVLMASMLVLNLIAATQDVATDGMAVAMLPPAERGFVNGLQVGAYRVGMIIGGGVLLAVYADIGHHATFAIMAGLTIASSVPVLLAREPRVPAAVETGGAPQVHFLKRPGAWRLIALIVVYKAGEAFAQGMLRPFLKDRGLGLDDIAWMLGTVGFVAGMAGALAGGALVGRIGRRRSLVAFGLGQVITVAGYAYLVVRRAVIHGDRDVGRRRALRERHGDRGAVHVDDGLEPSRERRHRLHGSGERRRDRLRRGIGGERVLGAGARLRAALRARGGAVRGRDRRRRSAVSEGGLAMRFLPPDRFVGILIEDVLDEARCAALLADLDQRGFEAAGDRYPRDYRNNGRLVFDDADLAASLFDQLRDELPAELVVDGTRWALCGLNSRFRACRYRDGQSFCIHRDGPHVPSDELRSHLTVQLYLDDAPDREGGRTRFYADPRGTELWAALTPKRGAAIVFDHHAWHDGEAVTAGIKHVLRTDVMYRRLEATAPDRDVVGRHRGYAWRVIACRDRSLASSGRDGTVRRWGRAALHDLGAGSVTTLVEDAHSRMWCGTRSGAIFVIDSEQVTRIADDVGAVLGACASGDHVVLATSRGTLVTYDAAPDAPAWVSAAHDGWAWSVIALGESFASCGEDGRIAITDRRGQTRTFAELGVPLRAIAADRATLIAGDMRGWLHRLDHAGDVLASIRAHAGAITCAAIAPDSTWVTGSEDGTVKRWRDGREVLSRSSGDFITSIAIDAQGDIVCSDYSGAIWIAR